jgi:hypothetical protein
MFRDGVWIGRKRTEVGLKRLEVLCRPRHLHVRSEHAGN